MPYTYNRRNWVNGEIITDEKLNNMEEGITEALKRAEDVELKLDELGGSDEALEAINKHIEDTNNPHNVTKKQLGLEHVQNVSTNDQTPTFTEAATLANIESGEKMNIIMGKIKRAITSVIDHLKDENNPHNVTKSQIGLGNVPNVTTNNQTPTYSDATTLATLASGEKMSVAFGKIKLALTNLISHLQNKSNPHAVTVSQLGAGTFSATGVKAKTGTDYTTGRIRNIKADTTELTAGTSSLSSGDVYYVYE